MFISDGVQFYIFLRALERDGYDMLFYSFDTSVTNVTKTAYLLIAWNNFVT